MLLLTPTPTWTHAPFLASPAPHTAPHPHPPTLRLQAPLAGIISVVAPRARIVEAVRPEEMSQDPTVVRHYVEDPLNFVGPVRIKSAHSFTVCMSALKGRYADIKLPIYAIHGAVLRCGARLPHQSYLVLTNISKIT